MEINSGDTSTLTWTSQNATSVVFAGASGGPVDLNGSFSVSPTMTTTYQIVVSNDSGAQITCDTTVKVKEVHHELSCDIEASPEHIKKGDSTTLTWSSVGAVDANISGIGSVSVNGSQSVSPADDTTYEMTVHDNTGQTFTCSTDVTVTKKQEVIQCIVPSDMMPSSEDNKSKLVDFIQQGLAGFGNFLSSIGISNSWADAKVIVTSRDNGNGNNDSYGDNNDNNNSNHNGNNDSNGNGHGGHWNYSGNRWQWSDN
jgi:hypothetical protein